jgi:hypothetical protein
MLVVLLSLLPAAPLPLYDNKMDARHFEGRRFDCRWATQNGYIEFRRNGSYRLNIEGSVYEGAWRVVYLPHPNFPVLQLDEVHYDGRIPYPFRYELRTPASYFCGTFTGACSWSRAHPDGRENDQRGCVVKFSNPREFE